MFRFVDSSDGYMEIYYFLSTFLSFSIYFFFLLKSKKIMSNVMDSVKIRDCKWETASIHRGYTQAHCCSVTKSWPMLGDPMDYSRPGFPVLHSLPEFAQTHFHCVNDSIQPSHPLLSPFPPVLNLSQHQGLF